MGRKILTEAEMAERYKKYLEKDKIRTARYRARKAAKKWEQFLKDFKEKYEK